MTFSLGERYTGTVLTLSFKFPPVTHPFTQGEDYEKPKNCKFLQIQEALETQTYGNNTEYTLGEIDGHNKSKELLGSDK